MRHLNAGKNLSRTSSHRMAMLRNMVTSLFKYERIETTHPRAKELKPLAERMITLAKKGDLHARRQALAFMKEKSVIHKLFEEAKDRYLDRQGGYIRIIKKGFRNGDKAPISLIEILKKDEPYRKDKKKSRSQASTGASETSDQKS